MLCNFTEENLGKVMILIKTFASVCAYVSLVNSLQVFICRAFRLLLIMC